MAQILSTEFSDIPLLGSFPASTSRMKLVRQDQKLADAEASQHSDLAEALDAEVPSSWPPKFVAAPGKSEELPWRNYYMVLSGDGEGPVLVGLAGVAPWPKENRAVQIGAAFVPEYQGRHLGAELSAALAEWALSLPEVDRAICDVPADHEGAAKALLRGGYSREAEAPALGFARFVRVTGTGA
jgi:RimJ/RimL family protein N-acetyltransferase